MPLVTSKRMLLDAQRGGYAVAAFNIENMEMAQAVIDAAVETGSPVLLQTTPSTLRYAAPAVFAAMVGALSAEARVPVALHLDHGDSLDLVARALAAGYTSAMIDGSALPFEDNVALTLEAVRAAGGRVPVEGELGKVGGKEDDLSVRASAKGDSFKAKADANTNPEQAVSFVRRTDVDSLAVGIGTAHGFYAETPTLDLTRLAEIRRLVHVPLVLHGASGLSDADVRACIARGICKVNFATELRVAYTGGVKQALFDDPDLFDPKKIGVAGKRRLKERALSMMVLCGCAGKA